jgi:signal transduction histidine kinase
MLRGSMQNNKKTWHPVMNKLLQMTSSGVVVSVITGIIIILLLFGFIIYFVFSYRHKQKDYLLLQKQKQQIDTQKAQLEKVLTDLKATQTQLIHSEKMASLGEITAGIAHEIQNPLNFVNNFSEINQDITNEIIVEINRGNYSEALQKLDEIKDNSEKINKHGKRADAIVKGMLQHSRKSAGQKDATDVNALCDEFLRLSYHGLRAKDKTFNAEFATNFDTHLQPVRMVAQDIGRVILNLINNAFYAVAERSKTEKEDYHPLVTIETKASGQNIEICVTDNGNGIPEKYIQKIFQPFFTTKPTGQGTGLGLSLSYDIVKAHGGEINLETKQGEGSKFVIQLPVD